MAINSDSFTRDVCIDFPYEQVMFRWDNAAGRVMRRFYGEPGEVEVPAHSALFRDAQRHGEEITRARYEQGKPR